MKRQTLSIVLFLGGLLTALSFVWAPAVRGALPPIEFLGSRPPRANEPPLVPFPPNEPLKVAVADSIITTSIDLEVPGPHTRYDIFDVDLDGDGVPEQIAQIARITTVGVYARCWWGIYSGGGLDQVLYWSYAEQKALLTRWPRPQEPPRDAADSLSVMSSIPEFFPLVDAVNCGDLNGDRRPETVLWMMSAFRQMDMVQSILAFAVVSPTPDRVKTIYRGHALYTMGLRVKDRRAPARCIARGYRIHLRARAQGSIQDILFEPWLPLPADSLCSLPLQNELFIPHDPDVWMPPVTMPPRAKIPGDWMISRWENDGYTRLRFVRDAKLD